MKKNMLFDFIYIWVQRWKRRFV